LAFEETFATGSSDPVTFASVVLARSDRFPPEEVPVIPILSASISYFFALYLTNCTARWISGIISTLV